MYHTVEKEYKILLERHIFEETKSRIKNMGFKSDSRTQINYYYDTPDNQLFKTNSTVRVRQNGEDLLLQIKKHRQGKKLFTTSDESEKIIGFLPNKVFIPDLSVVVYLVGCMITQRDVYYFGSSGKICFDMNEYLGVSDYEVEIEFDKQDSGTAEAIAKTINGTTVPPAKYSRFVLQKEFLQSETSFLTIY